MSLAKRKSKHLLRFSFVFAVLCLVVPLVLVNVPVVRADLYYLYFNSIGTYTSYNFKGVHPSEDSDYSAGGLVVNLTATGYVKAVVFTM